MFKVLEQSKGGVLGVEISGGYTKADVEAFKKAFEDVAAQGGRVNVMAKIDGLSLGESEFKAFWEDARYALANRDKLAKIAVVGHSKLEKLLVPLDNLVFGDKAQGLVEKYFDVAELDKAWAWLEG